jgi:hypothetical protein
MLVMTIRDLIALVSVQQRLFLVLFCLPPVVALIMRLMHGARQGDQSPWKYIYSLLVYLVCLPGILSATLTGYALFFTNQNLLDVPATVYLLPVISMVVTLLVISRSASFSAIPGFGRLSGLMVMMAMTFVIILAVSRTRIWLVFGGSISTLLLLAGGIFMLLKWGAYMAFRRRDEPAREPPSFP